MSIFWVFITLRLLLQIKQNSNEKITQKNTSIEVTPNLATYMTISDELNISQS